MLKEGMIVSRNKYNNDILFKIKKIDGDKCYLEGINERLCADSCLNDLKEEKEIRLDDDIDLDINYDRCNFFYLTPRVLHIDADQNYLDRCLRFYKKANINAYGICEEEKNIPKKIRKYLEDINPGIVIITGHDAYYKSRNNVDNLEYKNSKNFEEAVKIARNYENSYEKLKIIAGACQSNYEALIKAGANFASSPKRVNIHALDPAIIASIIALTENTKELNIIELLEKTKCKKEGIGGIRTYGSMYVGYPR